jgi:hypothetical protein
MPISGISQAYLRPISGLYHYHIMPKSALSQAYLVGRMSPWTNLTSHWVLLTPTDWAQAGYISLLVLAVILSNWLFVGFVDSKPEGRKTVLGKAK